MTTETLSRRDEIVGGPMPDHLEAMAWRPLPEAV
jgi:hypothetical protein